MKKLFSLAAAVLTALSMNAASIYLMGDGEGLGWDNFPGMEVTAGTDGYYTFTINNLNAFKFSTNRSTTWEGDNQFNAGSYHVESQFGTGVLANGGQTLPLIPGSVTENIDTPWKGTYVVKIKDDFSTINLFTTTPQPTDAPDAYIFGAFTSWNSGMAAWKFNVTDDGTNYVYTLDCSIPANQEFKIAGVNAGTTNVDWGGAINYTTNSTVAATQFNGNPITAYYNSGNTKLAEAFTGTVKLTVPKSPAKQNGTITFTTKGVEVTYPSTMYVLGEVNGNVWNPSLGVAMTSTGNKGEFTVNVNVTGTGYFSFTESLSSDSSNWGGLGQRYGSTSDGFATIIGTNTLQPGDKSFKLALGAYKFTVNLEKMTLTVAVDESAPKYPENLYIIGTLENAIWNPSAGKLMTKGEEGIFTISGLKLVDSDGTAAFSFCTQLSSDSSWSIGNRYGAGEGFGSDAAINYGQPMTLYASGDPGAFQGVPGIYDITVDLTKMTMTATMTEEEPTYPTVMYLIGDKITFDGTTYTGWDITNPIEMDNQGDGFFILENVTIEAPDAVAAAEGDDNGNYGYFAFTTVKATAMEEADWNTVNSNRYGPEVDGTLINGSLDEEATVEIKKIGNTAFKINPGIYTITFSYDEMELTMEMTEELPEPDQLYFEDINVNITKATPGTVDVPISIQAANEFTYQGFQFDITLPEDVILKDAKSTLVGENGGIQFNQPNKDENTYRVVAYFSKGENEVENIATLTLEAAFNGNADYYPLTEDVTITEGSVIFSTTTGTDNEEIGGFEGTITINLVPVPVEDIAFGNATLLAPSFTRAEGPVEIVTAGESLSVPVTITPKDADVPTFTANVEGITATLDEKSNLIINTDEAEVDGPTTVTVTAKAGDVEETFTFTVKPVLLGDANANGKVTVADVVTVANYLVAEDTDNPYENVESFCYPNALVNNEDKVGPEDIPAIVNIILDNATTGARAAKRHASYFETIDCLVADNFKVVAGQPTTIGVGMDNTYPYTLVQASVILPEGMEVMEVSKGARAAAHELTYHIGEGRVNVILYSFSNASFADSDDALFNLTVVAREDCGDLSFEGVKGVDAQSNGYGMTFEGGRNLTGTTGIDGIDANEEGCRYYNLNGIEIPRPDKGIYIRVNANGEAVKVVK